MIVAAVMNPKLTWTIVLTVPFSSFVIWKRDISENPFKNSEDAYNFEASKIF